jgi:hypothetical protein
MLLLLFGESVSGICIKISVCKKTVNLADFGVFYNCQQFIAF